MCWYGLDAALLQLPLLKELEALLGRGRNNGRAASYSSPSQLSDGNKAGTVALVSSVCCRRVAPPQEPLVLSPSAAA